MVYFEKIDLEAKELIFIKGSINNEEHDVHIHELLEIAVVLENEVRYRFNDRTYYGKPGDVFICRPMEAHWCYAVDPNKPYKYILVLFSPSIMRLIPLNHKLLIPFYTTQFISPLIPSSSKYSKNIYNAATMAVLQEENGVVAFETQQFKHFIEIILQIYYYFFEQYNMSNDVNEGILEAIYYILANITEDIDINKLVLISKLGKTVFFKKFKLLTGLTPNLYIIQFRLQLSVNDLIFTKKSIIDISEASGFPSLSTFNKQFKLHFGISPRQYRKQRLAGQAH